MTNFSYSFPVFSLLFSFFYYSFSSFSHLFIFSFTSLLSLTTLIHFLLLCFLFCHPPLRQALTRGGLSQGTHENKGGDEESLEGQATTQCYAGYEGVERVESGD